MPRAGGGNGAGRPVPASASSLRRRYTLYSAAVPAVLRRVRRQAVLPIACAALAALLVVVLLTFVPLSGDAPSHLFQTWLYRHDGFQLWNNLWYAGRYEFVSYSVLYYPLAAHTGELPLLAVAAATLAGSFAVLSRREWGQAARGPAIAFTCTTTFVLIVSGLVPVHRRRGLRDGRDPGAPAPSPSPLLRRGRRRRSASRRSRSPSCSRCSPGSCSAIPSRSTRPAATGRLLPSSSSPCSRAWCCSARSRAAASTRTTSPTLWSSCSSRSPAST